MYFLQVDLRSEPRYALTSRGLYGSNRLGSAPLTLRYEPTPSRFDTGVVTFKMIWLLSEFKRAVFVFIPRALLRRL